MVAHLIVVLANGCFDLLHYGHLLHLEEARKLGDWLVVAVTADHAVNKGPGRPVFNQEQRAAMVRALRIVDGVAIVENGEEAIRIIKPDIFVKGSEYDGKLKEKALVESFGGRCVFTAGPIYSSTRLLDGSYLRVQSPASGRWYY
mgnify:CR=1 FL=1